MKVLVCGDRNWNNFKVVEDTLRGLGPNTVIIHGDARGADKIAGWVSRHKLNFTVRAYPADWNGLGKRAGPVRNREMFDKEQPELVIAFHNDIASSKGTKDMVTYARSKGCPVNIVTESDH